MEVPPSAVHGSRSGQVSVDRSSFVRTEHYVKSSTVLCLAT